MKLSVIERTTLLHQLRLWTLGDEIENIMSTFNNEGNLSNEEEFEYQRLREQLDDLLNDQ